MIIGGLQKFSLLDYPGNISAIIFTQGCNFRCQYCYNPMLVWPDFSRVGGLKDNSSDLNEEEKKGHSLIKENDLFVFLKKRFGKLDAVVITGGEPTIHSDLPEFIRKIKKMGYKIKLDTNGTNPEMIDKLIKGKLVDYLAMDVKAPEEKYNKIVGVKPDLNKIKKSIKIIMESKLPYEFRTTVVPGLISKSDIRKTGEMLKGASKWYLQNLKSESELVNDKLRGLKPCSQKEIKDFKKIGEKYVVECGIR